MGHLYKIFYARSSRRTGVFPVAHSANRCVPVEPTSEAADLLNLQFNRVWNGPRHSRPILPSLDVKTVRWWRGIVPFTHLTREGRMTVTIGRRELLAALGGAAAAWPVAARTQQPERMRRIGIVMPFAKGDSEGEARIRAFKQELAKLGWTDGGNIQFDERWLTDDMDLVRSHAASLVASNPDIIVASGGRIVPVFMRLTRSIPMVLPGASDPVGVGWAQSLARPGGNLTGVFLDAPTLCGKWLQYIDDVVP